MQFFCRVFCILVLCISSNYQLNGCSIQPHCCESKVKYLPMKTVNYNSQQQKIGESTNYISANDFEDTSNESISLISQEKSQDDILLTAANEPNFENNISSKYSESFPRNLITVDPLKPCSDNCSCLSASNNRNKTIILNKHTREPSVNTILCNNLCPATSSCRDEINNTINLNSYRNNRKHIQHPTIDLKEKQRIMDNQLGTASKGGHLLTPRTIQLTPRRKNKYLISNFEKIATIFSFDGGGIRGVISAAICRCIEKCLGLLGVSPNIADHVNMFAGTSIGAALAGAFSLQDPRYDSDFLQNMFVENGQTIFQRNWLNWMTGGLWGAKYHPYGREKVFSDILGDATLADTKRDLLVTAYDWSTQQPLFFKSTKARLNSEYNFRLSDVIMCSTAAPTYFPPYKIYINGKENYIYDGGISMNNPAPCALAESQKNYDADAFILVSIGTGYSIQEPAIKSCSNIIQFAQQLPNLLVDTTSCVGKYMMYQYGYSYTKPVFYCRLDTGLENKNLSMDDCSPQNINELIAAVETDNELQEKIQHLCNSLLKFGTTPTEELNVFRKNRTNNFILYDEWKSEAGIL